LKPTSWQKIKFLKPVLIKRTLESKNSVTENKIPKNPGKAPPATKNKKKKTRDLKTSGIRGKRNAY
jgi:hypothetical protein